MGAPVTLRRVLTFRTVVSTSTGLAYAAVSLLACVQLASYLGGDSGWIAVLVAGLLALLAALCFSELNALYPSAAAIRQYMKEALNDNFSLIITFGYMLTIVAVIAADSYIVGSAITYAFGLPNWASLIWILALLALAMGANLRGIRIAGLLQDITTYTLIVFVIIISLIALSKHGFQLRMPFDAIRHPLDLVNAVAVGVFVFSAFEWVTPLSEEISNIRLIPRGMFVSLGLLFVSYALFTVASSHLLNVHSAAISTSPVPQMLLGKAALGQLGIWLMLTCTLLTAVMTFNGGFATASRFLYAAAREDTLPPIFARISISYAVPYVTVIALSVFSAAVATIIFLTGQFQVLILVGAVLEALIYTVAGLCVIQLRRRQPAAERSFRIRGGWLIPILTVVIFGLLAILAALGSGSSNIMVGMPLIITIIVFIISALYVFLIVPRLRAAAAKRASTRRRRRRRETSNPETSQG
ncbi:MAG TPA: APC family permease [Ktedonobacteraceae bacterium]|nr:APC family permease [Ktedonobacteraceae bacterium]